MSRRIDEPTKLTPEQFEREVQKQITEMGVGLSEFEVWRLEKSLPAGTDETELY